MNNSDMIHGPEQGLLLSLCFRKGSNSCVRLLTVNIHVHKDIHGQTYTLCTHTHTLLCINCRKEDI